jgi:hypothetical protein
VDALEECVEENVVADWTWDGVDGSCTWCRFQQGRQCGLKQHLIFLAIALERSPLRGARGLPFCRAAVRWCQESVLVSHALRTLD